MPQSTEKNLPIGEPSGVWYHSCDAKVYNHLASWPSYQECIRGKTIPVIYRAGVFVPMIAVDEIAEEASLEVAIYLPVDGEEEATEEAEYLLEQNLALLYQTAGLLHSNLPADEVR